MGLPLLFAAYFHIVIKDFGAIKDILILGKPVVAAVISSVFFLTNLNLFLKITAMILAYSVLLIMLRIFKKEDWHIFRRILNSFYSKNT